MVHRYNANNENKTNNNTSQKRIEFILRNCWRCEFGTVLQLKIQQMEDKIFKRNIYMTKIKSQNMREMFETSRNCIDVSV